MMLNCGFFVVMGLMMMVARAPINKYHNLLHLVWGAMAAAFGFARPASLALGAGLLVVGLFKGRHRAKAGNHET